MDRVLTPGAALLACVLVVSLFGGVAHAEVPSGSLTGIVRDSLGNALSGAEVLILPDPVATTPLSTAQTNAEGRYTIAELAPGAYRIAALKQGYLAYLGTINTLFRSSMDFVLLPAPAAGQGTERAPQDLAWTLRVPARSLLRDTEASDLLRSEESGGSPTSSLPSFYQTIDGQLDHLIALSSLPSSSEPGSTSLQGADTRMRLSSSLGERGSVRLQGRRESLDTTGLGETEGNVASRDASSLFVDVSYDTSRDANLAVKAYYASRDLNLSPPGTIASQTGIHQGQKAWGYDAAWSKQLDAASRLRLQVGYLDTYLGDASYLAEGPSLPELEARRGLSNRMVGAQGTLESVTDGHNLQFKLRAERLDVPADSNSEFVEPGVTGSEPAGWIVRLSGEDSWSVSGPISFVYGLGLDRSLDATEPALLVPRAGWLWSSDALSLRMIVSYHTFAGGSAEGTKLAQLETFRSDSPVGYDAQFETALPWGFRLKGGMMSAPVVYQELGLGQGMTALASPALLPLIESSAAVERSRLALERQTARVSASLQWAAGKIEGASAQLLPLDVPVTVFGEQSLEYRSSRVGVRFLATGTDLAAEFVSLRDLTAAAGGDFPAQNYVEIRIAQDLIRLPGWGGSCRLLVAARTTAGETDGSTAEGGDTAGMLAAMNQRLSAGLSVAF